MSNSIIAVGSDNVFQLNSLTDQVTNDYVNDATVSCKVMDAFGVSTIFSFNLSFVSNGNYSGIMTATNTALLTPSATYIIQTTATDGTTILVKQDSYACGYPS